MTGTGIAGDVDNSAGGWVIEMLQLTGSDRQADAINQRTPYRKRMSHPIHIRRNVRWIHGNSNK
jgi:hypothetical protein